LGGDNITVDRQSAIDKRFAKGEKEVMFKSLVSQNQRAIPGAGGLTTRNVQKKERPSFVIPLRFPGRSKTTALQAGFFGGALSKRSQVGSLQMDSVLESPDNNSRRMKNTSIFGDKP
jgi:hypothetical protein